ncbi:membrane integrity-associated transporter subunit PqiC [Dyella humi]|uniref:Membrane integrity-associated transporter subunit PqiC n=1 Tax=Dyella humi TaxID=1770547 RepID=A0ABW8IIT3_9GAMM
MKRYPLVIGLALLSGCASPGFRYHTLQPASDTAQMSSPRYRVRLTVVQIPAEVDTEQLVVRASNNTLTREPVDRWAAPLTDEIRGALDDAWRRDYGVEDVQNGADASYSIPRVGVQVQKLDATLASHVELVANWWVASGDGAAAKSWSCQRVIVEPAQGGIDGVVNAQQRVFAALAGDIATGVIAMASHQVPVCPMR